MAASRRDMLRTDLRWHGELEIDSQKSKDLDGEKQAGWGIAADKQPKSNSKKETTELLSKKSTYRRETQSCSGVAGWAQGRRTHEKRAGTRFKLRAFARQVRSSDKSPLRHQDKFFRARGQECSGTGKHQSGQVRKPLEKSTNNKPCLQS